MINRCMDYRMWVRSLLGNEKETISWSVGLNVVIWRWRWASANSGKISVYNIVKFIYL